MNPFENDRRARLSSRASWPARICLALAFSSLAAAVVATPLTLNVPSLGTASRFIVLSAAPGGLGAVTSTNSSIVGDVGSSGPLSSVVQTGGTIQGSVIAPVSPPVLADFGHAYDTLAAIPSDVTLTGSLAGISLPPGVYAFAASAALTGQLTLDGPANGIWVFKIGGGLTGTSVANVVMAGGAQPSNVYWLVGGAATLTDSNFAGTILAGANITVTRGVFAGKALAQGAVTLTNATATTGPAPRH